MSISVLKRKVVTTNKNVLSKIRIISFFNLRGGRFMEQITNNRFEMVEVKKSLVGNILVGISERSKMFYKKYLKPAVNYDYLEIKRIKENNLENVLLDTIRNQ